MIGQEERTADLIHDRLADSYGDAADTTMAGRLKLQLTRSHIRPGHDVLDVGCANGLHMRVLAPLCRAVTGVDINERMLALARARLSAEGLGNARVEAASASSLPFPDHSFDLAYSFSTLLLVPNLTGALAEMARVLRPGGTAVVDLTGRRNLAQVYWRRWYRAQGHFGLHALTHRGAVRLLRDVGLEVVEAHALGLSDQWRYVPGLHRSALLERLSARPAASRLDHRLSNLRPLVPLASRWYFVAHKAVP